MQFHQYKNVKILFPIIPSLGIKYRFYCGLKTYKLCAIHYF